MHDAAHKEGSRCFRAADCRNIFLMDSANSVDGDGDAAADFRKESQAPAGQVFFAVSFKNMSCSDVGTAEHFSFFGFRQGMAGGADDRKNAFLLFCHIPQNRER